MASQIGFPGLFGPGLIEAIIFAEMLGFAKFVFRGYQLQ